MQPRHLIASRERLNDAVHSHFARRPVRLQLITADQPGSAPAVSLRNNGMGCNCGIGARAANDVRGSGDGLAVF
jgi:hypothetical protein